MIPYSKMATAALGFQLDASLYLTDQVGLSPTDENFSTEVSALEQAMEQAKTNLAQRTEGDARESGWAKRAVNAHMDATSFLQCFSLINPNTPKWQVGIMSGVLGRLIEAEQKAREAAKARESDVMEFTDSAAA
jgi:hypothetical protein